MKKVLIAAVALMMGATLSLAGMGIFWSNGFGFMVENTGNVTDGPGVAENNDVIWQLIFAGTDNVANDPDLSKADYLGGDDQLLSKREIAMGGGTAADGTKWSDWLELVNTESTQYTDLSWSQAGFVYQRVWQGTPDSTKDSYYFDSALLEIDTSYAGGASIPQSFSYDPSTDPEAAGVVVDKFVPGSGPGPQVPEPATMSLLGLGALAMVLRRKMSK